MIDVILEGVQRGFVDPVVLRDLGIQAFQCLEVVFLVRVVERFSEVEILELHALGRSGEQEGHHGRQEVAVKVAAEGCGHRSYQPPSRMLPSPESFPASVIPISFGSTSLRNSKLSLSEKSVPLGSLPEIETPSWCSPETTLPV